MHRVDRTDKGHAFGIRMVFQSSTVPPQNRAENVMIAQILVRKSKEQAKMLRKSHQMGWAVG
jgi:ABC-type polar amino acid transport system ATPase subunit